MVNLTSPTHEESSNPVKNSVGKKKERELTYWVHGLLSDDAWRMLDSRGWHKVDPEERKPPLFARYRRTCKHSIVKQALVRPFPYSSCLSYCCDKKLFYMGMRAFGFTASVPETYTSYNALRRVETSDKPNKGEVWFVKTSEGCHGRGVQVFDDFISLKNHIRSLHNEPFVIQRGVSHLHLIEGRKWTVRSHVLIGPDLRLYRYEDSVIVIHGADYAAGTTDRAVQILHNRRASRYSLNEGPACYLLPLIDPQIERISTEVAKIIQGKLLRAAAANPNTSFYALLGLDLIVDSNQVVHCLEVNEFPQLDFSSDPKAHRIVVRMFDDFLKLVVFPETSPEHSADYLETGWLPLREQLPEVDLNVSAKESRISSLIKLKDTSTSSICYSTDSEKKVIKLLIEREGMERERSIREAERERQRERTARKLKEKERAEIEKAELRYLKIKKKCSTAELIPGSIGKNTVPPPALVAASVPVPPPVIARKQTNRKILQMHRIGVRVSNHRSHPTHVTSSPPSNASIKTDSDVLAATLRNPRQTVVPIWDRPKSSLLRIHARNPGRLPS